jgi:hypothetical protein
LRWVARSSRLLDQRELGAILDDLRWMNLLRAARNPCSGGLNVMTFVLIALAFVGVAFVAIWFDRPHP